MIKFDTIRLTHKCNELSVSHKITSHYSTLLTNRKLSIEVNMNEYVN